MKASMLFFPSRSRCLWYKVKYTAFISYHERNTVTQHHHGLKAAVAVSALVAMDVSKHSVVFREFIHLEKNV